MQKSLALVMMVVFALGAPAAAEDFPEFRGPTGQGHSAETGLPLTWSETENVAWKTPLPGLGWSSPSIKDGRIWLTTAVDEGHSLRAICLDRDSGRVVHDMEVFHKEEPGRIHAKNSHASPTPIIDGDRIYVHFGSHGTACLDADGKILWKTALEYYHRHGPGGSPIVAGDLLIINCDGYDNQFVVALNKLTGKEVWRAPRDGSHAYSTPLLIEVDGRQQVISVGGEWVMAYEPQTGEVIWKARYPGGYSNVPRPVFGLGLVFISSGYNDPVLYAIRPTGSGDVTDTHVAWTLDRGAPLNPSPLLIGEELYVLSDNGILTCLDARSGRAHWKRRVGGNYSASPLYADGRVYLLDEKGAVTVIAPNQEDCQELARNTLPGGTLASPAVSDGAIFIRTDEALWRIEKQP